MSNLDYPNRKIIVLDRMHDDTIPSLVESTPFWPVGLSQPDGPGFIMPIIYNSMNKNRITT